tara:strand:- start:2998 stop:3231 length:234 start_codon:yes stop_codon:yes gene_type:complete
MTVKIYSLPTCPYCNQAKTFLTSHKIKFEDINVEGNKKAQEEMVEKSGQRGTPVIDIDGKILVGFEEDKLKKALDIK